MSSNSGAPNYPQVNKDWQNYSDYPEPTHGVEGSAGHYHHQNPTPQMGYPSGYAGAPWENNPPPNSGKWNAKLCGCGGNCLTCCIGCWCPCILIGQNIEIIDRGNTPCLTAGGIWAAITLLSGCGFVYSFMYRQRFREKFGLPSPCPDIIVECCCQTCSACQIDQELKSRNIEPSAGYDRVRHIYEQPPQNQAPSQQEMR